MNRRAFIILTTALLGLISPQLFAKETHEFDVVIYGGTSAAVTGAVQPKRIGKSVIIVTPDKHIGGLSAGGLGFTDTGRKDIIGGIAREFYGRIYQHYQKTPEAWELETSEDFEKKNLGFRRTQGNKS